MKLYVLEYLIIIIEIVVLFRRLLKNQGLILRDRIEISGLMAGLCAIAVHSFVDFNYYIAVLKYTQDILLNKIIIKIFY